MEADFTIQEVIALMKKTKKTDPLFKPLKKLKTALESIGLAAISFLPTKRVLVFHFGLGNEVDKQFIKATSPAKLAENITIIPGHAYCMLNFTDVEAVEQYMNSKTKLQDRPVFYSEINYQNLSRILVFFYCKEDFLKQNEVFPIADCPAKYDPSAVPGLIMVEDILTKEEEAELLAKIDEGKWEKLNNRRVQHHGYQFKYGRNQIDKEDRQGEIPNFLKPLLQKLAAIDILKGLTFDQLTINDYFAGNGIPPHFDTHSPFEEIFISVSLLSSLVMDFRKYDGEERLVYLKDRSVAIFSGEARYAWIHGISGRKVDKVDGEVVYRSRRLSLTFRKIRFTPCNCPYYFFCDSQGYDQQKMKKNNPLLTKYLSTQHTKQLESLTPPQIQRQFVDKAYNGFGFDFHNRVIEQVKLYMEKDIEASDIILDIGCGNGEYRNYIHPQSHYIGIEKCTVMVPVQNELHMDCLKLGFRNSTIDKILFVAVLHHFASQETRLMALKQAKRVMKEDGVLYLTILSYENKKDIYSSPETFLEYCLPANKMEIREQNSKLVEMQKPKCEIRGEIYKRYYHLFTIEEIRTLFDKAGLQIIELQSSAQNIIIKAKKIAAQ